MQARPFDLHVGGWLVNRVDPFNPRVNEEDDRGRRHKSRVGLTDVPLRLYYDAMPRYTHGEADFKHVPRRDMKCLWGPILDRNGTIRVRSNYGQQMDSESIPCPKRDDVQMWVSSLLHRNSSNNTSTMMLEGCAFWSALGVGRTLQKWLDHHFDQLIQPRSQPYAKGGANHMPYVAVHIRSGDAAMLNHTGHQDKHTNSAAFVNGQEVWIAAVRCAVELGRRRVGTNSSARVYVAADSAEARAALQSTFGDQVSVCSTVVCSH